MGPHLQPEWIVWFWEVPRHLVKAKHYCSPDNFAAIRETWCIHIFYMISLIYHLQLDTFLSPWTLIIHLAFSAFFFFFSWMFAWSCYDKWNKWSPSTSVLKISIFNWTVLSLLTLLMWVLWKAAAVFQEPSSRYVIFFQGDSWGKAAVRLLQLGGGIVVIALEKESFFICGMINKWKLNLDLKGI